MSPERAELQKLGAEVEVLKLQVAELKCLSLMQNAFIGRLAAEMATASEGTQSTREVLGGMLASLGGVVDRMSDTRADAAGMPTPTPVSRILGTHSNDVGEAEGKAIWRLMRIRA